jgi:glycosyltransferase involved in cell wall biosynthesis
MRISVIMAVNLGYYDVGFTHSASDPTIRFRHAVESFRKQHFKDAELLIVSDGCKVSEAIYYDSYFGDPSMRFRYIDKQEVFSGVPRNTGLLMAKGDIICYLDHDDAFGPNHLQIINDNFDTEKNDWVWYNDYVVDTILAEKVERNVFPALNVIGTSAIAHKRNVGVVWEGEYAHDWRMIEKCLLPLPGMKIPTPEYYVCHFRRIEDL